MSDVPASQRGRLTIERRLNRSARWTFAMYLAATLIGVALSALLLWTSGADVVKAFSALLKGAFWQSESVDCHAEQSHAVDPDGPCHSCGLSRAGLEHRARRPGLRWGHGGLSGLFGFCWPASSALSVVDYFIRHDWWSVAGNNCSRTQRPVRCE